MYTVAGEAEGKQDVLKQYANWLYTGSPQSSVDHVKTEYQDIDKLSYDSFEQR